MATTNQTTQIVLKGKDDTQAAFASVGRGLDQLGIKSGQLSALGGVFTGGPLGIAAGATAAAAAVSAFAISNSKAVDQFNDLQDATGASIGNISALDRVARETGGSFETAAGSLLKFNKALGDATDDNEAGQIFKALKLDVAELRALDPAEALQKTAIALEQYAVEGDKARAIQTLFGKSVQEAAPFLKDLAEKGALVATVTAEQAAEAEKFNKELFKFNANATDASRALSLALVTAINQTIEAFRQGAKEGKGFFATLRDEQLKLLGITPSDGIADARKELTLVDARLKGLNISEQLRNSLLEKRASLQRQIGTAEASALIGPQNESAAEAARLGRKPQLVVPGVPTKTPTGPKTDPLAEARSYLENLQNQLNKTKDLTVEEQALFAIQNGRFKAITPELEKQILTTARLTDLNKAEVETMKASEAAGKAAADAAGKLAAENEKLIQSVETPAEALERKLIDIERLLDTNPLVGAETAARLGTQAWKEYIATLDDVAVKTQEVDQYSVRFAENIQDALGSELFNVLDGNFDNIGDAFGNLIKRMLAEALAADFARALGLGGKGKEGGGLGEFLSVFSSVGGLFGGVPTGGTTGDFARMDRLASFDVGTDFVPYDMVAKIHRGEKIIPAAQNVRGAGGDAITIVNQTTGRIDRVVEQRISPSERAIIISEAVAATNAQFADPNSRGSRAVQQGFGLSRSR